MERKIAKPSCAKGASCILRRGVLLRPLVNRDQDRLIYIRQGAPGTGATTIV